MEDFQRTDLNPAEHQDEIQDEMSLRPFDFKNYIGQKKVVSNLKMFILAAKQRKEALDHCLLSGPPGLGKTTLSNIIARQMEGQFHSVAAPAIEKKGDIAALLTTIQEHDVLFIDEIHRLPRVIEEVLYGAMEEFKLNIIIGQGPAAKSIKIDLPKFTLVGATTRTGLLTSPLRDRFGLSFRLDFYPPEELKEIVKRTAGILNVEINEDGAHEVARRSRGTPRIANRLLRRVRDFAQVKADGVVTEKVAKEALGLLDVDSFGLDAMDRRILSTVVEKFSGGPVGIETLSSAIGEERGTLEDVYEPFLIQEGFMQRTPRGRLATKKSYELLGVPYGEANDPTLF